MKTQDQIHNEEVGKIIDSIVRPVLMQGGSPFDAMVLTESVVLGVILATHLAGVGDESVDILSEGVKKRLAEHRLVRSKPEGSA